MLFAICCITLCNTLFLFLLPPPPSLTYVAVSCTTCPTKKSNFGDGGRIEFCRLMPPSVHVQYMLDPAGLIVPLSVGVVTIIVYVPACVVPAFHTAVLPLFTAPAPPADTVVAPTHARVSDIGTWLTDAGTVTTNACVRPAVAVYGIDVA